MSWAFIEALSMSSSLPVDCTVADEEFSKISATIVQPASQLGEERAERSLRPETAAQLVSRSLVRDGLN